MSDALINLYSSSICGDLDVPKYIHFYVCCTFHKLSTNIQYSGLLMVYIYSSIIIIFFNFCCLFRFRLRLCSPTQSFSEALLVVAKISPTIYGNPFQLGYDSVRSRSPCLRSVDVKRRVLFPINFGYFFNPVINWKRLLIIMIY